MKWELHIFLLDLSLQPEPRIIFLTTEENFPVIWIDIWTGRGNGQILYLKLKYECYRYSLFFFALISNFAE